MNQILYAQEQKKKKPVNKKKIIIVFAVAIAIFGLVIIALTAKPLLENIKKIPQKQEESETPEPIVEFTQTEENDALIKIESEVAISHIIYRWNNESPETLDETGKTNVEEKIHIPAGENILNISVIDTNGKETKKQKTYIVETSKPVIELISAGNNIKIKVTAETELSYVSYKWNQQEIVKEDMYTYENRNLFEKSIEIPVGENTLKVEAEDITGNKSEKSLDIKAFPKAVTNVLAEGDELHFTVTGTDDIEKVEFELNEVKYVMNTQTFGQTKVVDYKVKMAEGWNYLIVTSTTVKGAVDTTYWKYEYGATTDTQTN